VALVSEPAEVAAIAADLARAPLVAFDLEFLSQDRLVPTLCLLQVSWLPANIGLDATPGQIVAVEPSVRLIDPLAVDVRPVIDALVAHKLVVAHAPRQDLGLLATRFGASIPNIIDTQLMAAFAGIGDQVGLAALANELLGTSLAKDQQWTAWEKRPLSEAQVTYAAADVRYLPGLYALLAEKLGHERVAWAREESANVQAEALAASAVTPDTAWEHVGGARHMEPVAHAAVVALAAWRQRTAVDMDRPLGQVLNDKVLVEIAKTRPDSANAIRGIKGISPIAKTRAQEIVEALANAPAPKGRAEPRPQFRAASPRAQRWAEMLLAIVQVVVDETGIAARLLATRSDAEEFARAVDEKGLEAARGLPALSTWRRAVIGEAWEAFLGGTAALRGDLETPQGLRLVWKPQ
jgi:ribonuclease D